MAGPNWALRSQADFKSGSKPVRILPTERSGSDSVSEKHMAGNSRLVDLANGGYKPIRLYRKGDPKRIAAGYTSGKHTMKIIRYGEHRQLTEKPNYRRNREELAELYGRFTPEERAYAERDIWAGPEVFSMTEAEVVRGFILALNLIDEDATGYRLGRRIARDLVSLSSSYCPYRGCRGGATHPDVMCLNHQQTYARVRYAAEVAETRGFKSEDILRGALHVLQGGLGEERAAEIMCGARALLAAAHS